ncbi:ubiquinone biosynthesis protein COQ4 [Subsaxibacter sp. CAU 1640]|uniref:ubiquinone biosynthesis protein COQ4 n=1 Tax=Subsaxibacter sp. CAU 1640 TaxID=2933271 RepID=UPI0020035162|nr:ubiquinone biosynthesis protein COQ4 [Subsaxibacter sp. CAU 1640]MCK7591488.1 ubiquinone biosynthesis protein COQ4 [Subsaxibacter sp. CAU 1640]
MKQYRKQLIEWLFDKSQKVYTNMFKNHEAWGVTTNELLTYPTDTLGRHLGEFLHKNGFELIPKVERHDAYHTLTGYGTNVEDEIALQCLCFGNGKRSLYLYGAMILGIFILPDYWRYYYRSYHIGKNAHPFHHFDYKKLLNVNIHDFRSAIFSSAQKRVLDIKFI